MTPSCNPPLLATDGAQLMESESATTVRTDVHGGGEMEMSVVLSKLNLEGDRFEDHVDMPTAGVRTHAEIVTTTISTVEEVQKYATTSEQPQQRGLLQGSHGDGPLNVMDAVGYLDAVENTFKNQRKVYLRFLDIMKEFKSEQIDTSDVVQLVSQLFHGHPVLIQGFNAFLPVGYQIECSLDPQEGLITVTTPTGTTTHNTNGVAKGSSSWTGHAQQSPPPPPPSFARQDTGYRFGANSEHGGSVEPAVQFVDKVKQQCDPSTYRQFLRIMSRFRHEPDSNGEEVSRQIERLFKDAPDLLANFRIFRS